MVRWWEFARFKNQFALLSILCGFFGKENSDHETKTSKNFVSKDYDNVIYNMETYTKKQKKNYLLC